MEKAVFDRVSFSEENGSIVMTIYIIEQNCSKKTISYIIDLDKAILLSDELNKMAEWVKQKPVTKTITQNYSNEKLDSKNNTI